jgi:hypothetical protein
VDIHSNISDSVWETWVSDNIIVTESTHTISEPGDHVLKYWMVDSGVVLQKLVVYSGQLKQSYLGPPSLLPLNSELPEATGGTSGTDATEAGGAASGAGGAPGAAGDSNGGTGTAAAGTGTTTAAGTSTTASAGTGTGTGSAGIAGSTSDGGASTGTDAGAAGTPPQAGAAAAAATHQSDDSGCGCRVPANSGRDARYWSALALMTVGLMKRRRFRSRPDVCRYAGGPLHGSGSQKL